MKDKLIRLIELTIQKRRLNADLDEVSAELRQLADELLAEFGELGLQAVRAETPDGRYTVSLRRTLWARPKDGNYAAACAELRATGLGDFVEERFNVHRLSAYVRELDRLGEHVNLTTIDVEEKFDLGVSKA